MGLLPCKIIYLASYESAAEMGIPLVREWMCVHDGKTRPAHRKADGQQVGVDEPFIVGGEKLMFPANDSMGASPANCYNCRCRVKAMVKGHERKRELYEDWEKRKQEVLVNESNPVYNKTKKSTTNTAAEHVWYNEQFKDMSAKEIADYFKYTDEKGKNHNPIRKSFTENLDIEAQRLYADGMEWVRNKLGLKAMPTRVEAEDLHGDFGLSNGTKFIKFDIKNSKDLTECFGTGVHEMIHYSICKMKKGYRIAYAACQDTDKELKKKGYTNKEIRNMKALTVGWLATSDGADENIQELVAYSVEKTLVERGNEYANTLSNNFFKCCKEYGTQT